MIYFLLFSTLSFSEPTHHRMKIESFDFQNDTQGYENFYFHPNQIEFQNGFLYAKGYHQPFVIRINPKTKRVTTLGRAGRGPGEYQQIGAMGADEGGVWIVDIYHRRFVDYYVDGQSAHRVELMPLSPYSGRYNERVATSPDAIVTDVHPSSGRIGAVYKRNGEKGVFGEPNYDPKVVPNLFGKNPNLNQVTWAYGDEHWFAVYAFANVTQKYDKDFKLVETFTINHGPLLDRYDQLVLEWEPRNSKSQMLRIQPDAAYFNHKLYVLGTPYLYELDPQMGTLESISYFYGEGPEFVKTEGGPLGFYSIAFSDDGELYLCGTSGDYSFGHDLWKVSAPSFLN